MAGKRKYQGASDAKRRYKRRGGPKVMFKSNFRSGKQSMVKTSRTYEATPITVNTVEQKGGLSFTLDSLPNYTQFTNLFDEYMITGVKVKFMPEFCVNTWDTTGPQANAMPVFLTAIDYDDAVAPTNKDALLSNESCVVHAPGVPMERFIVPKVSTSYWQSAVASGFGSDQFKWIDASSAGVSHYGLKYVLSPGLNTLNDGYKIRIFVKIYARFRKSI